MAAWLEALSTLERNGEPAVLVTVLSVRGSAPREAGCKMVVSGNALFGTIGGGNLEYQCSAAARGMLADGTAQPVTRDFPLGPALGQCCGGHVTVLFECIRPASLRIALFGAGHVGRALVRLLGDLPCRVDWLDNRLDAFPATVPSNVHARIVSDPERVPASLLAGSFVLVMTHEHELDFAIVAAALRRADFAGIGLIGSATKRARFTARLRRLGFPAAAIDRLICPIGVPGIDSKLPEAIAIAVAAQILQATQAVQPITQEGGLQAGPNEPVFAVKACNGCAAAGVDACAVETSAVDAGAVDAGAVDAGAVDAGAVGACA